MRALRLALVGFILILATVPFVTMHSVSVMNRNAELARQEHIREVGSLEGYYGDCSGASIIVPFIIIAYAVAMLAWSVTLLILTGTTKKTTVLVQVIVIGAIGLIPNLFWLWFLAS